MGLEGLERRREEEAGGKAVWSLGTRCKASKSEPEARETADGACTWEINGQSSNETLGALIS